MAHESGTVNIRFPHFAPMSKEDTAESRPEYDTPFRIGEATNLTRTPTIQNVPAYADGIIVESFAGSPGGNVSLGIHALGLNDAQKMFGSRFDSKGVLLSGSNDTPPYGALLFEAQKGNGKTRWMVLFKVKWQVPELTINTKTETVTWQQPTLTGTYQSRMDLYTDEKGDKINLTYADYDEDHEGFDRTIAENWYKEVYEPEPPAAAPAAAPAAVPSFLEE